MKTTQKIYEVCKRIMFLVMMLLGMAMMIYFAVGLVKGNTPTLNLFVEFLVGLAIMGVFVLSDKLHGIKIQLEELKVSNH